MLSALIEPDPPLASILAVGRLSKLMPETSLAFTVRVIVLASLETSTSFELIVKFESSGASPSTINLIALFCVLFFLLPLIS